MKSRAPGRQPRGFTLIELLIAMTISGFILVALARIVDLALAARATTQEQNEAQARLRFASRRIAAAIAAAPLKALAPKPQSSSSGDWLAPVTYNLADGILTEQDTVGTRTIAEGVTNFSLVSPPLRAGRPVIEVSITIKAVRETTATSNFAIRLGGPA
jgi:prepilin-type N-terminal cleavage/methylation domain-containing protein